LKGFEKAKDENPEQKVLRLSSEDFLSFKD